MNAENIFITGATGHLGTEIVLQLLEHDRFTSLPPGGESEGAWVGGESSIFVLMRESSRAMAEDRLRRLWWSEKTLCDAVGKRVIPVLGDITKHGLNISEEDKSLLRSNGICHIIHCAAETSLMKSREELWQINVEGTKNVVDFAKQTFSDACRFAYISTAYVAGRERGVIKEEAPLPTSFFSLYEESKAEAEQIVRKSGLDFVILRPGMIVGNSKTGRTLNFNTVYYVLKLMLQGKLRLMPISPNQTVNLVPVDYVASAAVQLLSNAEAIGKTFHLTLPHDKLPKAGELIAAVCKWAEENLNIRIKKPLCITLPLLGKMGGAFNLGNKKRKGFLANLLTLMPYFYDNHQFNRTNTESLTTLPEGSWQEWLPAMLSFACRHNFMKITSRTIFEQAMVRRESKHFPITYFNINAEGISEVTGTEMNTLVQDIVRVLLIFNAKAGDRIALTGINCTEQAAIDCAIGLIGAVSVPIYYTTPSEEAELLLQRSKSSLFFIGDNRMIEQVAHLANRLPIITFANANAAEGTHSLSALISSSKETAVTGSHPSVWRGRGRSFVGSSLATIRYTSGTTGEPKGVMFSSNQLKWMGEVLTNLLPWHDRNTEMRYLSFLPMSHVVEGILAAYAPYCMLCKVKFFYLNDFALLTQALPKVRPTVFFSVPRFFEKLWDQIEQNPLGKHYLRMKDGMLRRAIAAILRKAVLRKAGLDRCSQLLVGSAPISDELLLKFRHLGIEIHNAYGQTEAPLISLNRLGNNIIPSIGTPLPATTVTVSDDGELLVQGPQVAMGYYNLPSDTFRDGVLHTGDLGEITNQTIYIKGRKKDLLITSYGKNINCSKIEQRLTDIGGITHAVLVGEQRPYCCALLWAEGDTSHVQAAIDQMNTTLSHPEQVRKWRVIKQPLSIAHGELTPSLKIRRNIVWEHFGKEVSEFYE